ncbi:ABC-type dipeptide/oligopeptide/nickel transport system permease component [Bradyrhizobium sp. GM24.11]
MSRPYLRYAAKRLVQALVVILLAYVFTFVVVSILPGDPITNASCAIPRTVSPRTRSGRSSRLRAWTNRYWSSSGRRSPIS